MIDWYDLPPKQGLFIGLIIAVSRSPIRLTAGKMIELSMNNFAAVSPLFNSIENYRVTCKIHVIFRL